MNQLYSNPRCKLPLRLLLAGVAGLAASVLAQTNPASSQSSDTQNAVATDTAPSIEVAVIKPHDPNSYHNSFSFRGDRLSLDDQTVSRLIAFAWAINQNQIVDAPNWIRDERFDMDGETSATADPTVPEQQQLIRKLLADRFGLKFHREKRDLAVYALVVAKGGPKLAPAGHPDAQPGQHNEGHGTQTTRSFTSAAISDFVLTMQFFLDRPLVDQTGLTGRYDFNLTYTYADASNSDPDAPPPLFTALQEQLGLKFQPTKAATDVLVVDHVDRPSAN
ncbi:MAG: TIGR03435 family protein [Terracidiphilus sp.]